MVEGIGLVGCGVWCGREWCVVGVRSGEWEEGEEWWMGEGQTSGRVGVFFVMIRRPPRATQSRSSAASGVYKGQKQSGTLFPPPRRPAGAGFGPGKRLSFIHTSEPTRPY